LITYKKERGTIPMLVQEVLAKPDTQSKENTHALKRRHSTFTFPYYLNIWTISLTGLSKRNAIFLNVFLFCFYFIYSVLVLANI